LVGSPYSSEVLLSGFFNSLLGWGDLKRARDLVMDLAPTSQFPPLKPVGDDLVRVMGSAPSEQNRRTFLTFLP
jgi:hypothetical protein